MTINYLGTDLSQILDIFCTVSPAPRALANVYVKAAYALAKNSDSYESAIEFPALGTNLRDTQTITVRNVLLWFSALRSMDVSTQVSKFEDRKCRMDKKCGRHASYHNVNECGGKLRAAVTLFDLDIHLENE
ncbi:hypothetical protein Trydic_g7292 [Trypoxylus dichotomus]